MTKEKKSDVLDRFADGLERASERMKAIENSPQGMFYDWTPAQKKRWALSGSCGLIVFVILYAIFANLFPLYFPSVDDHLGALIGAVICMPVGLWVWFAVYSRWPLPKGATSFFKRGQ